MAESRVFGAGQPRGIRELQYQVLALQGLREGLTPRLLPYWGLALRLATTGDPCRFYLNANSLAVFSARSAAFPAPQALMHQNPSSVSDLITTAVI